MKKKYITPASTVVSLQTATIIAASRTNRYYDNQGDIVYDFDPVDAEDAD
jgi:hypothetical protein